jgi:ketosteroid isomerase-like protein
MYHLNTTSVKTKDRHIVRLFYHPFILFLVIFSGCHLETSEDDAIKKVLLDQTTAWNNGNIALFMEGYHNSDSLIYMTGKGIVTGYEELHSRYRNSFETREKMGNLRFETEKIRFLDRNHTLGAVPGRWIVVRNTDTLKGHFFLIFKKFPDEGWKIIADNTW